MILHGAEISLFTGKVEGYLKAKGIPFTQHHADIRDMQRYERATGIFQIPHIELENGEWLTDSTRIMDYFERNHPDPNIYLKDPVAQFLSLLLEEYFDEWIWAIAINIRFYNRPSGHYTARRVASTALSSIPLPTTIKKYGFLINRWLYLRDLGVVGRKRKQITHDRYLQLLSWLDPILSTRPYLQGERPTAADFGLFGPAFRHFFCDPYSGEILRREAPSVNEWCTRVWNLSPEKFRNQPEPEGFSSDLMPLLVDFNDNFVPYLKANLQAYSDNQKQAVWSYQGETWQSKMSPYQVWSLAELQKHWQLLPANSKAIFTSLPELQGISELLSQPIFTDLPEFPELPIREASERMRRDLSVKS